MKKKLILLILPTLLLVSCVKKKQIEELNSKIDNLSTDVNGLEI